MGTAAMGSFICALIAIVFPYIKTLFSSEHIEVSLPHTITLSHNIGVMEITPWIHIKNSGGKKADIESIRLVFSDRDGKNTVLVADSYANSQSVEGEYLPWNPIAIGEDQAWSGRIKFRPELSESTEEIYRKLRLDFARAKESALPLLLPPLPNLKQTVKQRKVIPDQEKFALISRAKNFFDNVFFLKKGDYKLTAVADSALKREAARTEYKFVVFESTLNEIKNISEPKETQVDEPFSSAGLLFDQDSLALSVPIKFVGRDRADGATAANSN